MEDILAIWPVVLPLIAAPLTALAYRRSEWFGSNTVIFFAIGIILTTGFLVFIGKGDIPLELGVLGLDFIEVLDYALVFIFLLIAWKYRHALAGALQPPPAPSRSQGKRFHTGEWIAKQWQGMTGPVERGRILYDEAEERRFSWNRRFPYFVLTGLLLFVSALLMSTGVSRSSIRNLGPLAVMTVLSLGFWLIVFLFWRDYRFNCHPVTVYENGIVLPRRTKEQVRRGEKNYLPFDRIEKAYVGAVVALDLKDEQRVEYFISKNLYDPEAFVSAIRGRVNVEWDASWDRSIGVVWKVPDTLLVDELSCELAWRERIERIAFDDVERLEIVADLHRLFFRDKSVFKVLLDKDMSHQLTEAWKNYEERFWRDPEAEEKRWEKLEDTRVGKEEK
ncbi:MAG: hypothetical protein ACE5QF_06390 [Thermoplasmata archaeon]